ncbi:MAG: hypothetical protein GX638_13700 [Crenarchaeota archaeon]|nr:hypothetical protein [Thermoproteota archaeon]
MAKIMGNTFSNIFIVKSPSMGLERVFSNNLGNLCRRANRPLTAKSQNACRRRNTGTSAVLQPVSGHRLGRGKR